MDFREGLATASLEKAPKLNKGLSGCGKAIDPHRVTALGGLASIAQAPKRKGQTGELRSMLSPSDSLAPTGSLCTTAPFRYPYWQHAAGAVRVEPVGTA